MKLEVTQEELQLIINALAELPAKVSFNILVKLTQSAQLDKGNAEGDV